jgi:hypothetical protein
MQIGESSNVARAARWMGPLGHTKVPGLSRRWINVASPALHDEFCLYLWRSLDVPGTLYLARNLEHAKAVYAGLIAEGYVVKVVHAPTNTEYAMCDGALLPIHSLTQA